MGKLHFLLFSAFAYVACSTQSLSAEVDNPTTPQDWSFSDRANFTERWNRANVLNILRGAAGSEEYQTIGQRTDFYNWFDQIRKIQQHEIMWPSAAWVVSGQMRNLEDPARSAALAARRIVLGRNVDGAQLLEFASSGNQAIFNDVFPKLKDVFERGMLGKPLKGEEAKKWDQDVLRREQFDVAQPLYERYARKNSQMAAELKDLASGGDILAVSGIAIGNGLDFSGDILKPQDRFDYGMNVVVPFYLRFEKTVDSSRARRQLAKPDPTAGGMVQAPQAAAEAEKKAAEEAAAKKAAEEAALAAYLVQQQEALRAAEAARQAAEAARAQQAAEAARQAAESLRQLEAQMEAMRQAEAARMAEMARQAEITRQMAAQQAQAAMDAMAASLRAQQEQAEAARRAAEMEEAMRRMTPTIPGIGSPSYPGQTLTIP